MSYGAQSHCVSPHIASHCLHNDHIPSCKHKNTQTLPSKEMYLSSVADPMVG